MQEFLISTSDDEHFQEAFDSLHNRSLLYDKDNNKFGIVYDGFNVINSYVDDVNIKITDDKISLSDDVLVKSTKSDITLLFASAQNEVNSKLLLVFLLLFLVVVCSFI